MTPAYVNDGLWTYRGDAIHSHDPSGEGGCYVEGLDAFADSLEDACSMIDVMFTKENDHDDV